MISSGRLARSLLARSTSTICDLRLLVSHHSSIYNANQALCKSYSTNLLDACIDSLIVNHVDRKNRRELSNLQDYNSDFFSAEHRFNTGYVLGKSVSSVKDKLIEVDNLPLYHHVCSRMPLASIRKTTESDVIKASMASFESRLSRSTLVELMSLMESIRNQNGLEFEQIRTIIESRAMNLLKTSLHDGDTIDIDSWFHLCNLFYEARIVPQFSVQFINYMVKQYNKDMTSSQLINLLFLITTRRSHDDIAPKLAEKTKQVLLEDATIQDVAIICQAYFKTKRQMYNRFVQRAIIERTIRCLDTVQAKDPCLSSILKSLRYSSNMHLRADVQSFLQKLISDHSQKIFCTQFNAIQTVKLMEAYRIHNQKILDSFWDYLTQRFDELRFKDIQYSLTSLSNFAYNNFMLDEKKSAELRYICDNMECSFNPDLKSERYVLPFLRSMAMFGVYNDRLIALFNDWFDQREKAKTMLSAFEAERSLLLLHTAMHIENSGTKIEVGPILLQDIANSVQRNTYQPGPIQSNSSSANVTPIRESLSLLYTASAKVIHKELMDREELRDPRYKFSYQYTMAHQNYADLVISLDVEGPGCYDKMTLLPKLIPDNEKHVIALCFQDSDFIDNHSKPSGYKMFIMRLLQRLGYKVIIIKLREYSIGTVAKEIRNLLETE